MIKVSVIYPFRAGARFDHDYYARQHLPLVAARMGDACLFYTIDRGLSGGLPGSDPAFEAMCHIHSPSVEHFNAAFGPHAQEILGDIPNYTDLEPIMQISQVVVGPPAA